MQWLVHLKKAHKVKYAIKHPDVSLGRDDNAPQITIGRVEDYVSLITDFRAKFVRVQCAIDGSCAWLMPRLPVYVM
jgi:hypothetical protein